MMIHGIRVALDGQVGHEVFVEVTRTLRHPLDNPSERILV